MSNAEARRHRAFLVSVRAEAAGKVESAGFATPRAGNYSLEKVAE